MARTIQQALDDQQGAVDTARGLRVAAEKAAFANIKALEVQAGNALKDLLGTDYDVNLNPARLSVVYDTDDDVYTLESMVFPAQMKGHKYVAMNGTFAESGGVATLGTVPAGHLRWIGVHENLKKEFDDMLTAALYAIQGRELDL